MTLKGEIRKTEAGWGWRLLTDENSWWQDADHYALTRWGARRELRKAAKAHRRRQQLEALPPEVIEFDDTKGDS